MTGVDRLQVQEVFSGGHVIVGTHTPRTQDTGEGGLGEPPTRELQGGWFPSRTPRIHRIPVWTDGVLNKEVLVVRPYVG